MAKDRVEPHKHSASRLGVILTYNQCDAHGERLGGKKRDKKTLKMCISFYLS